MSDILIKGMEMPKNCFRCEFSTAYFTDKPRLRCAFRAELMDAENICRDARPNGCPLVEVKEVKFKNSDDALKLYSDEKKIWTEASE